MAFEQKIRKRKTKQERLLDSRVEKITGEVRNHIFRELRKSESLFNQANSPSEIVQAVASNRVNLTGEKLESFVANYVEQYRDKISSIRDSFGDLSRSITFDDNDLEIAKTIIDFDIERIRRRIDVHIADIDSSIVSARLQGNLVRTSNLEDNIGDKITNTLNTEVTTNLDAFERTETVIKARKLGFRLFLYVGGLIKTSRDFCIQRDGKVYSWEEVKTWDNGQLAPASIYLGGYNCRHHLSPLTDEIAKDEFGYTG